MERALALAEQSVGLASPNPAVGCVLVHDGREAGEGFHQYDRLDHAEIAALKAAGSRAEGATAYITLEPCSHQGRTGPCADALIGARVRRVVFATRDPNPLVHGRGSERLRSAGIEVTEGVLEEKARRVNDSFARFVRTGLPMVTVKIACSLDGRIAPASQAAGERMRITGEEAHAEVQRMRHAADALLTGVGTVLADDPLLTDRSGLPRRRPLLRVVLDSRLRTPASSRLVASASGDLVIFFTDAPEKARRDLEERGARVKQIAGDGKSGIALAPVLETLAAESVTSVMVEGGGRISAAVLGADLADKLVVFFAPLLLGANAVPAFAGGREVRLPQQFALKRFGGDFAWESYLRDPWAEVK